MPTNFLEFIPFLSASGLAGVNVFLLFRVLGMLSTMSETMVAMLEYLRHHNPPG